MPWTRLVASRDAVNPPAGKERRVGGRHHPSAASVYLRLSVPLPARLALPRRWFDLHLGLASVPHAACCCCECKHSQDDQWPSCPFCVLLSCLFLADLISSFIILLYISLFQLLPSRQPASQSVSSIQLSSITYFHPTCLFCCFDFFLSFYSSLPFSSSPSPYFLYPTLLVSSSFSPHFPFTLLFHSLVSL